MGAQIALYNNRPFVWIFGFRNKSSAFFFWNQMQRLLMHGAQHPFLFGKSFCALAIASVALPRKGVESPRFGMGILLETFFEKPSNGSFGAPHGTMQKQNPLLR